MRHRPPSKLFLILHKDSQICFLLALISHAKVKWEALTFLVNFVVFTAYGDCETFIHSLMNAVHFHFLQSFFLGLCFNAQEWAWGQCIPQPPVLVCLSVWCWLLWCQSVCQVLVTMVPVYLSGAGCCSDCLMLLLFRIWSKEISLYWKWAVDLEKWRPSIWWPLCRECHCDPTGNWYNSLRYYVENCLPCSVNTL